MAAKDNILHGRHSSVVGLIALALFCWATVATAKNASNLRARTASEDARIDPSGMADSWQGLTALLGTGGVSLKLPCGTYLVGQALALRSHTELYGAEKACVVIKMKQDMAANPELNHVVNRTEGTPFNKTVVSNADYKAGNSDISLHDLSIDIAGVSDKRVVFLAFFYSVTGLKIERVKFVGSTGVAQSAGLGVTGDSAHIVVKSSSFTGLAGGGACISVWDGTRDVLAQNNDCDGGGKLNFGIQANGSAAAAGTFRAAGNIKFIKNTVRDVRVVAIDIDGLCSAKQKCGEISGAQVLGNDVEKSGVWGVRVGHAAHVEVADNTIRDTQQDGVAVLNQLDATMIPLHDISIEHNTIENPDLQHGADAAGIRVGGGGDAPFDIRVHDNTIGGHPGLVAVRFHRGPAFAGKGSISGTAVTIAQIARGSLVAGERLTGPGVAPGTRVLRQTSGAYGGVGRFVVDRRQQTGIVPLAGASDEVATP